MHSFNAQNSQNGGAPTRVAIIMIMLNKFVQDDT